MRLHHLHRRRDEACADEQNLDACCTVMCMCNGHNGSCYPASDFWHETFSQQSVEDWLKKGRPAANSRARWAKFVSMAPWTRRCRTLPPLLPAGSSRRRLLTGARRQAGRQAGRRPSRFKLREPRGGRPLHKGPPGQYYHPEFHSSFLPPPLPLQTLPPSLLLLLLLPPPREIHHLSNRLSLRPPLRALRPHSRQLVRFADPPPLSLPSLPTRRDSPRRPTSPTSDSTQQPHHLLSCTNLTPL